jgi:beta-N-acetylhexosaminidase
MPSQIHRTCGQLVLGALDGPAPSAATRKALSRGERAGFTFFRRNLVGEGLERMAALASLARELTEACDGDARALLAIDQEGGRVMRLGEPALQLPPMRALGVADDVDLTRRVACAQARELAGLGLTMSFAPVADVHSEPSNPVIGDRAFSTAPERVAAHARAFAAGLADGGILACAKHFPGHGDTTVDSHKDLPRVDHPRARLDAVELAPFRALSAHVPAMMSAHVVYAALDADAPATLSHAVATGVLRGELGFEGALMSDDLEMRAIRAPVGESAVLAVAAGCDVVLVCVHEEAADEAFAGLVREAEKSAAFRARCAEAHARSVRMRAGHDARPPEARTIADLFAASDAIRAELAAVLASAPPQAASTPTGVSPVEET